MFFKEEEYSDYEKKLNERVHCPFCGRYVFKYLPVEIRMKNGEIIQTNKLYKVKKCSWCEGKLEYFF